MNFYEQIFSRGRATGEGMTHFERLFAAKFGGSPPPEVREYTGPVPVTITADGTPLLDYIISGNTTQNGTPTPDNPIMPEGGGERTGNLWEEDYTEISGSLKYVPIFVGDGTFTLSTDTPDFNRNAPLFLLSGNVTSGASTPINGVYNGISRTTDSLNGYITIAFRRQPESSDPTTHKTMLNLGSTALPYEPYGIKIPISSAGQTTPVYLGEVETTRKIKKLVLTGQENITQHSVQNDIIGVRIPTPSSVLGASIVICSHYEGALWPVYNGYRRYGIVASNPSSGNAIVYMSAPDSEHNTLSTFVQWIKDQYAAGTPVTVWYVLADPETAVVNEPLMRIGDYADTLSYAQAGVAIPTNNGSTTVDVETTLKPSEIYIKYMG